MFNMTRRWVQCALFGLVLAGGLAVAADNFTAGYPISKTDSVTFGSATLTGIFQGLGGAALPDGTTSIDVSLRGTGATVLAFASAASAVYQGQVSVPKTGATSTVFSGATLSQVMDQIRQFLLEPGQVRALARESARSSPFDPVAGNPSSLMARVVAYDFGSAFFPFASNIADGSETKVAQAGGLPAGAARGPMPTLPGIGAQFGLLRDSGQSVRSLSLPLSLTLRSDLDPRRQFSLYLPLTVSDVNGARTTQGTVGAALRLPLARDWALSGNVGYSVLRAPDLGTAGKIGSLALTSSYVIRGDSGDLGIGNMVGRYQTLSGTVGGIDTGSEIANTVFRNGLLWSMPAPGWFDFGRSLEFSIVNTHYTGSELYLRNYTELGLALGTNRRADSQRSYMQGGLSVLVSSKTKGVLAHYGYWF